MDRTAPGDHRDAIPARLEPFIGRSRERTHLRALVAAGTPLVTVSGLAGVGKSRLVLETLSEVIDGWICASEIEEKSALISAVQLRAESLLTRASPDNQLLV